MAITLISGFESGNAIEWASIVGVAAVTTAQKNTGAYSLRCNPTSSRAYVFTGAGLTYYRASFYIYISSTPDSDSKILGGLGWSLYLTTERQIDLYEGVTKRVDGSTVLTLNTWYRISVSVNSADGHAYYWINGNAEGDYDGTNLNLTYNGLEVGQDTDGVTADLYFDDIVFDNTTGSTSDLGAIRVATVANPNADGDEVEFDTPVGSATHYMNVDDPAGAISDADYNMHAAKSVVQEYYNLDSCADIGLSGSDIIDAVMACARYKLSKTGDTLPLTYVKDNGIGYTMQVPTDANTWTWAKRLDIVMPNGGAAWSQARFDAFQVGMQSSGAAPDLYLSCVFVFVAYHAGVAAAWKKLQFASEPPTPNAWNQLKLEAGTGWKKLLLEGE